MKRQEIEKLMNIFQKSEKIKKEKLIDELLQRLCKTNITIEEMTDISKFLKAC